MSKKNIEEIEVIISKCLKIGVLASAAVIALGLALYLITGTGGYADNSFPTDPAVIFQGLGTLKPFAVILTGLFILILTPVFRVGISIIVFLKEKDLAYVKITAVVLGILIVSFLLGKVE